MITLDQAACAVLYYSYQAEIRAGENRNKLAKVLHVSLWSDTDTYLAIFSRRNSYKSIIKADSYRRGKI